MTRLSSSQRAFPRDYLLWSQVCPAKAHAVGTDKDLSEQKAFSGSGTELTPLSQGKQERAAVQLCPSPGRDCRSGSQPAAPGPRLPACGQPAPQLQLGPLLPALRRARSTLHFAICNGISFGLLRELFLNNFPFKPAVMGLQHQLTLKGSALRHLSPGSPADCRYKGTWVLLCPLRGKARRVRGRLYTSLQCELAIIYQNFLTETVRFPPYRL